MSGNDIQDEVAFKAALDRASATCPHAAAVLHPACYLASRRIPVDLFSTSMKVEEVRAAVVAVVREGLAATDPMDGGGDGFTLKPAVQELGRSQLARIGDQDRTIARAMSLLAAAYPAGASAAGARSWPQCERLSRHVQAALSFAPDTGEDAATTSELLHRVAQYLFARGRFEEAIPLVQRSGAIDELIHGPDDEIVGQGQANLAMLLHEMRRNEEALPHIRRSMEIGEANLGPEHPIVAERYNILATLLEQVGRPAQADPFIRHALLAAEVTLGADHPDTKIYRANYERIIAAVDDLARRDDAVEEGLAPAPAERMARLDIPPPPAPGSRGVMARLLSSKRV